MRRTRYEEEVSYMLLAEGAAKTASAYTSFDPFVLILTVIIAVGFIRLLLVKRKNVFAIGFTFVALATFGVMDYIMISGW
jgi:hypothetical protein